MPDRPKRVRKIFVRAVSTFYRRRAQRPERTRIGTVHSHALWADGVFAFRSFETATIHAARAPSDDDVARPTRALRRRRKLDDGDDEAAGADPSCRPQVPGASALQHAREGGEWAAGGPPHP